MVAQSGGEVNRLLDDRRLDRRMVICPEANKAQNGMAEQHGRRFRAGPCALGLHPALELRVRAFDGVGGPQGLPVLRRIAEAR